MAKKQKIIIGIDEVGRTARKASLAQPEYVIGIDEVGRAAKSEPRLVAEKFAKNKKRKSTGFQYVIGIDEVGRTARKASLAQPEYVIGIDEVGRAAKSEPRLVAEKFAKNKKRKSTGFQYVIGIDEVGRTARKASLAQPEYVIGIDEVGRGPLAGPVTVGAVAVLGNSKLLEGIKDSKKLNAKTREEWNAILRKNFECRYASASNGVIDKIGIKRATLLCVRKVLRAFKVNPDIVLLDGLLKAPERYNQKTIIKGDEKIPAISAASIIAKVARDRKMAGLPKKFAKYGFAKHKGYGTKEHFRMIKKHGVSKIHRKSFLRNLQKPASSV